MIFISTSLSNTLHLTSLSEPLYSTRFSQIQQNLPSSPDLPTFMDSPKLTKLNKNNSRMPLTNAQTTFLFEDSRNMAIGN